MRTLGHVVGWMLVTMAPTALAGPAAGPATIPTLDDVGLAVLVGLLGALGGWLAQRHRK
jgi:hypothetical protein